ncbi:hypothetical protein DVS28_a0809 [Euzebya pacifica]|uniref:Uncharacterized protein n=1 Tax=Euzebya pacifica TaxID=1608957 RepID=A0A346XTG3_9ACTN|nr:hypothetical protein DVS28_a0809 [Euzebya pacifica]
MLLVERRWADRGSGVLAGVRTPQRPPTRGQAGATSERHGLAGGTDWRDWLAGLTGGTGGALTS